MTGFLLLFFTKKRIVGREWSARQDRNSRERILEEEQKRDAHVHAGGLSIFMCNSFEMVLHVRYYTGVLHFPPFSAHVETLVRS